MLSVMRMKVIVLFMMSLLGILTTVAQEDYESLLSESKVWTMMIKPSVNPEEYGDLRYINETKLVGDTVINGIHFKQKYERQCKQGKEMPAKWSAKNEFLGQDNARVFCYSENNKSISVIMDLSLTVGDIFCLPEDFEGYNLSVYSQSVSFLPHSTDNKLRRCLYLAHGNILEGETQIWTEGVGSLEYGIIGDAFQSTGAFLRLMKCSEGDDVLYEYKEENAETILNPYGRRWIFNLLSPNEQDGIPILEREITLWGDTLINSIRYMREYIRQSGPGEDMLEEWLPTDKYISQEEGIITEFSASTEKTILLMNFNVIVGETVEIGSSNSICEVVAISDTILDHGIMPPAYRRCVYVKESGHPEKSDIWIEGIGSLKYGIMNPSGYEDVYAAKLKGCKDGLLYLWRDTWVTCINRIISNKKNMNLFIYDFYGRRLSSIPCKGLYIQSGKKVIMK